MYLKAECMYMFLRHFREVPCQEQGTRTFSFYKRKKTKLREDKRTLTAAAEISQHLLYCRKGRERLSHLLEVQSDQAHMVAPLLFGSKLAAVY